MLKLESVGGDAVRATGRLDAVEAPAAQAFLDAVNGTVTLECQGLEYISSAGLGVLLKTHKRLAGQGGRLRLAGVSPHIRDILRYSGFDRIFDIAPAAAS